MSKKYIIKYRGAVEIEAENEAEAEELAWIQESIRDTDIISIKEK